jgi:hypothetical protein
MAGPIPADPGERGIQGLAQRTPIWDLPFVDPEEASRAAQGVQGGMIRQDVNKQNALLPGQVNLARQTALAQIPVEQEKARLLSGIAREGRQSETIGEKAIAYAHPLTGKPPKPNTPRHEVEAQYVSISPEQRKVLDGYDHALQLSEDIRISGKKIFKSQEWPLVAQGRLSMEAFLRSNKGEAAQFQRYQAQMPQVVRSFGDTRISNLDMERGLNALPGLKNFRENEETFDVGVDMFKKWVMNNKRMTLGLPPIKLAADKKNPNDRRFIPAEDFNPATMVEY